MICPKCNGRGTVGYFHIDHFVDIECDRCNGSGEVTMTNEEWLKSMTTEELADKLSLLTHPGILFSWRLGYEVDDDREATLKWLQSEHE